jgi:hypothetical protein
MSKLMPSKRARMWKWTRPRRWNSATFPKEIRTGVFPLALHVSGSTTWMA